MNAMKRTLLAVCLIAGLLIAGCRPAERPAQGPGQPPPEATPPAVQPAIPPEPGPVPPPEVQVAPEPAAPKYSAEQVAAAKELATQLGARMKEDAAGNVTSIDMAAGRSWADDAQMQQILVFEKLNALTLEGPNITDALVPRIAEHANLTTLALRNTFIGDEGIAQLTGLGALKTIELRAAPMVSDAAMQSLATMPGLRAVRLVGGNVTDAGVAALLALPRLSELDVRNCRGVTRQGIEQLAAKKSLRVLKIGGPNIDDDLLKLVAGMDNLTGLVLDNCSVTDDGVAGLVKLPLVDLTVYQCTRVTDEGLEVLAGYGNLQRLTLSDVPAKGSALAMLPHPEKLVSLNLAQSRVTDAEVAHIASMKHLESLNLSQTTITDAAIETLSGMASLEQLILSQTGISEEGIGRLRAALPDCAIRAN